MTDQATLAANTLSSSTDTEEDRLHRLERLVEHQSRQIGTLAARLEQAPQTAQPEPQAARERERDRERELPYRFEAGPKWLLESGWREQSAEHRKAWPVLWRILELERWPSSRVRLTHDQLADHIGVSPDTVKRRLRWLQKEGVVDIVPGSGQRPTTVAVYHPIKTPIPYAEVPWPAGGMAGSPPGYLRELAGPKRYYAELYGVELPEPVPGEEEIPYQEAPPPVENPPDEPSTGQSAEGVQCAWAGGAVCPPSETGESDIVATSVCQTRARGETNKKDGRKDLASKVEAKMWEIPNAEISEEAVADARRILETYGVWDHETATSAAKLAQYLRTQDQEHLLNQALPKIYRVTSQVRIARPIRYLVVTLCNLAVGQRASVDNSVAQRVLTASGEGDQLPSRDQGDFKEGYEWFFGEGSTPSNNKTRDNKTPTDFKEGYEWFFE